MNMLVVEAGSDEAWEALRRVGDAHKLFAPVLVDGQLDGDTRTVRFANGMVVHERMLDVNDERRRVADTALDVPGMTYHHASMQIVDDGTGPLPVHPDHRFPSTGNRRQPAPLIEQGAKALKSNLEGRR